MYLLSIQPRSKASSFWTRVMLPSTWPSPPGTADSSSLTLAKPFVTRNLLVPPCLNFQAGFESKFQTFFGRSINNKKSNLPTKPSQKKLTSKKRLNFFSPQHFESPTCPSITAFKSFFCMVTPLRLAKALCPLRMVKLSERHLPNKELQEEGSNLYGKMASNFSSINHKQVPKKVLQYESPRDGDVGPKKHPKTVETVTSFYMV